MKISIIITSYNYSEYITEAINSVLCQLYDDYEIVIIDDASTDNSLEIIREIQKRDNRIKVLVNEKNLGIAKTLQKAIDYADGDWIVFLESDDVLKSNYLSEKIKAAEKYPKAGLIFNAVEFFGENAAQAKEKFQNIVRINSMRQRPQNMLYDFGYINPILTLSSVMVKTKYLKKVKFNSPIDKLTDWYIYVQLASKTKFLYLDKTLTLFRQHDGSYVNSKNNKHTFANIAGYLEVFKTQPFNLALLLFILVFIIEMLIKKIITKIF